MIDPHGLKQEAALNHMPDKFVLIFIYLTYSYEQQDYTDGGECQVYPFDPMWSSAVFLA